MIDGIEVQQQQKIQPAPARVRTEAAIARAEKQVNVFYVESDVKPVRDRNRDPLPLLILGGAVALFAIVAIVTLAKQSGKAEAQQQFQQQTVQLEAVKNAVCR